jgi:hypothetical protein
MWLIWVSAIAKRRGGHVDEEKERAMLVLMGLLFIPMIYHQIKNLHLIIEGLDSTSRSPFGSYREGIKKVSGIHLRGWGNNKYYE